MKKSMDLRDIVMRFFKRKHHITEKEFRAKQTAVFNTWLSIDLRKPYSR